VKDVSDAERSGAALPLVSSISEAETLVRTPGSAPILTAHLALTPGTRLGIYDIVAPIGEGGMGQVYRATDAKLKRQVAIKVLPPSLADDTDRLARFQREAEVLASLNHPNIAAIYGLQDSGGMTALVMELVDGDDLSQRIARGALPLDEALLVARQIADALEAAHEQGIVHRDLKPANIKVRADGTVKVLDFGLAKAMEPAAGSSPNLSMSPTIATPAMTQMGAILGTAAYMAPEQARGAAVDKRADIWAFGVVLYEMLTGRQLFDGGTVSDVLAAVLRQDVDFEALPADTPPALRTLVARCLERDPKRRLRDIGEARVLLSTPLEKPRPSAAAPRPRRAIISRVLPWLLLAVAALMIAALARSPAPAPPYGPATVRLTFLGPIPAAGAWFTIDPQDAPVVSPDGRTVALPLEAPEGKALYLRPLDTFDLIRVEGGGRRPFFSPDGGSVAFARVGSIWKMNLDDRQPALVGRLGEVLWDVGFAAWHPDGRLLIPGIEGLWSMPASGGDATLLVTSDASRLERFAGVAVLPDGRLLLNVQTGDAARLELLSSTTDERRVVASGFELVRVVGDLLVSRHTGQWRARRLDLEELQPSGPSIPLSDVPEATNNPLGRSLAWVDGSSLARELVWVSRQGVATPLGIAPAYLRWPRVSPDGARIAMGMLPTESIRSTLTNDVRLGVFDLRTRARSALDGWSEPVWTADGRGVITSLGAPPSGGLGEQVADGSRRMEVLFKAEQGDAWPTSVSRDGNLLIYYGASRRSAEGTQDFGDIFVLDRRTQERRQVALPGHQRGGRLSPDGRWLAFESLAGNRSEIHVRPFPDLEADYMVSPDGGDEPAWSPDSTELYYRRGSDLMVLKVPAAGASSWPAPDVLFTGTFARDTFGDQSYDVAPDGRFLMMRPAASGPIQVQVVLDWLADVRSRLAAAR
jgi:eukaryotic-like serine/threonine-protein kinase